MGAYGSPELHPALRDSEYDRLKQLKWKYCEKCGHKFLETEKACPKCGYKPKGRRSGWTVFWAVIAILEAAFIGYAYYLGNSINNPSSYTPPAYSETKNNNTSNDSLVSMYEYTNSCKTIDYHTLARNPEKYKGDRYTMNGKVMQVIEISGGVEVLLNVTYEEFGLLEGGYWEDTIMVLIPLSKTDDRILEDDIITIWGECKGLYTYETVIGSTLSVPSMYARYYKVHD